VSTTTDTTTSVTDARPDPGPAPAPGVILGPGTLCFTGRELPAVVMEGAR